ncbi:MAG: thioredoxin [Pseudomonadota bacterium]
MAAENVVDVTIQNFQQVLLEGSKEKLIIIDFWADWCESCKQLMPILERIAAQNPEQLTLAKVNCDDQQELAMQFGIRSLPTVAFFKDGQPLDSFTGVKSESEIKELLSQHLPSPTDNLISKAQQALAEGNAADAYTYAKQAYDVDSTNIDCVKLLAEAAVDNGRLEQAKNLANTIPMVEQNQDYQRILSKIELAENAADSPELRALQEQVDAEPEADDLRMQLAVQLHQAHRDEEALQHLFRVLRKDPANADARRYTLDIINALPDGDPLSSRARRELYSMMY